MRIERRQALQLRSELLRAIRDYFYGQGLLEVATATLREYGASEPHLVNLEAKERGRHYYLQTSPEYAMKCLLAEFKESIFQICPAYRGGEVGARHRLEFQMLEWYRCGFDLFPLMKDLVDLLHAIGVALGNSRHAKKAALDFTALDPIRVSYRQLFENALGINPHRATIDMLVDMVNEHGISHLDECSGVEDYLDALHSTVVEPRLSEPTLVYDFPACQAALAEIEENEEGDVVARRFEFYAAGLEIANAYQELTDRGELERRFEDNNVKRQQKGLPVMAADERLLEAMDDMPKSAGIALGIDRLLMLLLGTDSIDQAICSP